MDFAPIQVGVHFLGQVICGTYVDTAVTFVARAHVGRHDLREINNRHKKQMSDLGTTASSATVGEDTLIDKVSALSVNQSVSDLSSKKSSGDDITQLCTKSEPENWSIQSQDSFIDSFPKNDRGSFDKISAKSSSETTSSPSDQRSSTEIDGFDDEPLEISPEEMRRITTTIDRMYGESERVLSGTLRDLGIVEANMMSLTEYLDTTLGQVLARGLAEIIKRKPKNPAEFLAAYLLADQARIDSQPTAFQNEPEENPSDEDDAIPILSNDVAAQEMLVPYPAASPIMKSPSSEKNKFDKKLTIKDSVKST